MCIDCECILKFVFVYEQIVGYIEDFGQFGYDVLVGVMVV